MTPTLWRGLAALVLLSPAAAGHAGPPSIYDVPVQPMKTFEVATSSSLAMFKGKVLLLVNVASRCGFTNQYQGLEALQRKYGPAGLQVLGFPSNDFMGQEPGTEEEIVKFCQSTFHVSFPLYAKLKTTGSDISPLYKYLTEPATSPFPGKITWNFNKFVVGRDGKIVARFGSKTKPDDPELVKAVEAALGPSAAADGSTSGPTARP